MNDIDYSLCKILYLDDEQENLDGFKFAFRRLFTVFTASTPTNALAILENEKINIIISDYRMPEINGVQFLEITKDKYPDIIRIILTGFGDFDILLDAINNGNIYRFITKPWEKSELENTIRNAYEANQLRAENKYLIKSLRESNFALELHKQHLENLVVERTQELEQVNEELVSSNEELRAVNETIYEEVEYRKGLQEELEKHKNHLQELVDERTKKLNESQEKLKQITENITEVVILQCIDSNDILYYNKYINELFEDEIDIQKDIFATILKYIHPNDVDILQNHIHQNNTNQNITELKFRIVTTQQHEKTIWVKEKLLFDKNQQPYRKLISLLDISLLDLTQKELQLHRDHLQQLVIDKTEEIAASNQQLASINEELISSNDQLAITNDELFIINQKLENEVKDREIAQQRLKESEDKFRSFIEQSVDGISLIDDQGVVIEWNHSMESITSISKEIAIGKFLWEIEYLTFPPEKKNELHLNKSKAAILNYIQSTENEFFEFNGDIYINDTLIKNITLNAFPIKINNQKYIGRIVTDTTIKHNQEIELEKYQNHLEELVVQRTQQLTQNEIQFRTLFEQAGEGIIVTTPDGEIVDANHSILQLIEYSRDEVISKNATCFFDEQELMSKPFRFDLLLKGETVVTERFLKTRTGKLIEVEMKTKMLSDGRMQGFVRDITERRKGLEYMQRATDIVNNIQLGMFIYRLEDPANILSLRMMEANPASGILIKANPADLIGKTIDEIFPNLTAKGIPQIYANVVKTGVPIEIDDFFYEDNNIFPSAFSIKAFPLPNQQVGITFENTTEKKRMQDTLKYQSEYEKILLNISTKYIGIPFEDIDNEINKSLKVLAEFTLSEMAYLFQFDSNQTHILLTHYWKNENAKINIRKLKAVSLNSLENWRENILQNQDVSMLNKQSQLLPRLSELFKDQISIANFILEVPLISGNKIIGIVGLNIKNDKHIWADEDAIMLKMAGQTFINAIKRKEIFNQLINSEQRHRAIFEKANDAILLMKNQVFIACNPKALEMFEYTEDELIGLSPYDLSPAIQANSQPSTIYGNEKINQTLQNEISSFEWIHCKKGGALFDADVRLSLVQIENEQLIQVIIRDVTQQKEIARNLEQKQHFINRVADTIPGMLYVMDIRTSTMLYYNNSFNKILGYSDDEIKKMGRNFISLIMHPQDNEALMETRTKILTSRNYEIFKAEYRLRNKKGEYVWFNDWVTIFETDVNNAPIQLLGIALDVSNNKFFELALIESEQKFRNIFNNSSDIIILSTAEGLIIDANDTFFNTSNYIREDFEKQLFKDIIKSNNLTHKKPNTLPFEGILMTAHKTEIPVEVNSRIIDYHDEKVLLSMVRNISERKIFERKLFDTMIETEEHERQRLAQDLHDEIGPILSSLKMYISTISDKNPTEKNNYIIEQVSSLIKTAISSVREISNALSPHVLNNYGVNAAIKAVIETASQFVAIQWNSNIDRIRFNLTIEIVYYRIVKELINNTIKHADAKNIEINLVYQQDTLILEYNDNGKGFDYEQEMKDKKEGIGLFSILNRVKTINADYNFDAAVGKGCKFTLSTKTSPIESAT